MEKVENTMGGANTFELEGRIGDLELKLGGNLQEQIKNTTQIFNTPRSKTIPLIVVLNLQFFKA